MASYQRLSANSSQGETKEDEALHQLDKEMENVNQDPEPISTDLEEAAHPYAFC